jgi:hypothetical protein
MRESLPSSSDTIQLSHPTGGESVAVSPVAGEAEALNDEVMLSPAPERPGGTIRVKLVYAGRSMPIPADDPWTP